MTRLARRNRTRWIKQMKARGYKYRRGYLWVNLGRWKLKTGVTVDGFVYGPARVFKRPGSPLPPISVPVAGMPGVTIEFPPIARNDPYGDQMRTRQRQLAELVVGPMVARVLGELGVGRWR